MINLIVKLKHLKFNLSLQIAVILLCTLLFGDCLNNNVQRGLYTISLILKELLLFFVPFIIFFCSFFGIASINNTRSVAQVLFILFVLVCASNYISTMVAYGVSYLCPITISENFITINPNDSLISFYNVSFDTITLNSNYALASGLLLGVLMPNTLPNISTKLESFGRLFVNYFFYLFTKLLPIFVLGFLIKMQHDEILFNIIGQLLPLAALIIFTYFIYLSFLFLIISNFDTKLWLFYLKNIMPAVLTGVCTMSSLAAMPITIAATEKNVKDADIVRLVIPLSTNIHMIGLAINIPMIALAIMINYGYSFPPLATYAIFAFHFALMQFAAAGAPGCGILLMIPVLETYLHFTHEMSGLIVAIYILFDAAETGANVLGNSALTLAMSKICKALHLSNPKSVTDVS